MGQIEVTVTESALSSFRPQFSPGADDLAAFVPRKGPVVKVRVHSAADTPRWLVSVLDRLSELSRLADEPDPEAPLLYPEAVQRALPELVRFMRFDTPTPSLVPTLDGGVQFVWHKGGWDVEVEVGPKETLLWAQQRDGDVSWHGSLDDHLHEIRNLLSKLASRA